jgi:hypothetical protein
MRYVTICARFVLTSIELRASSPITIESEPTALDPEMAGALRERNLLHFMVADRVVDKKATLALAKALTTLIKAGAFDSLAKEGTAFHAISMSRMGYYGDTGLAQMLFEELEARGLARQSQDGVSIPLHPTVRYVILVLLAQILRPRGPSMGFDLSPATDQVKLVGSLMELLDMPRMASAGHVVAFDLQSVSVDLTSVPLDEVLSFRKDHQIAHRRYVRSLRNFARDLSFLPPEERESKRRDRQAELDDLANEIKRNAKAAWKRPASFAMGLAGAAWNVMSGDMIAALFNVAGLVDKDKEAGHSEAGAFSYLFSAHRKFS